MTREDLNGKNYQEVEPMLSEALDAFKAEVDKMMTIEELNAAEEKLMEEAKEYDQYLNTVEYTLPEKVDFGGKNYSKNDIAKCIIRALNKMEVEWSHTLGLYELVKFWKNKDVSKIPNKAYDSTLRVLNQVKYKGFDEWEEILATNAFLANCHNEYSLDTGWYVLISEKHNAILQRSELVMKENNIVDEHEVVMQ